MTISQCQKTLADPNSTESQKEWASKDMARSEEWIAEANSLINAGQTQEVLTAEMKQMDDQKSVLDKQQDGLSDQIKALQSQQAALLK